MAIKDMIGVVVGRLTVVAFAYCRSGKAAWKCRCECGKEPIISGDSLRTRNTLSCGCLQSENRFLARKSHGMSRQRVYRIWLGMMARCYHEGATSYPNYGAKGISVHPWWHHFMNFYVDMGEPPPRHEIDRKDKSIGYTPSNCRWVTKQQNNMNRGKQSHGRSRFKGVRRVGNKWTAAITANNTRRNLGRFASDEEAARAYDAAARELHGDFACCNFPEPT